MAAEKKKEVDLGLYACNMVYAEDLVACLKRAVPMDKSAQIMPWAVVKHMFKSLPADPRPELVVVVLASATTGAWVACVVERVAYTDEHLVAQDNTILVRGREQEEDEERASPLTPTVESVCLRMRLAHAAAGYKPPIKPAK